MNPEKFGRYEIKAELGRGGMATVYQAYDPRFEREVAIKVLPREMLHDPQFRTRFEREAKTIAMLEHPAIVPVYDFGEEEGQPYFVMRYMTGGSLSDRIGPVPLNLAESARIFTRLAPAMDEAHAKGIVHRDLKPGNILFDRLEEPYISDFGIVKITEGETTNATGSAIIGTPSYMSPEQAQGEPVDGRADIYALGVILFEMLSGQKPYNADTPMGVVVKHITEPVPNILEINPSLPPEVETVIQKAMAKDKAARFASCVQLAAALETVARGKSLDLATLTPPRGIPPAAQTVVARHAQLPVHTDKSPASATQPNLRQAAPKSNKNRLWIGLGAAAVLICVALVAIFFIFKDRLFPASPLAEATPTHTLAFQPSATPEIVLPPPTSAPSLPPNPSETPAPSPTPTATATATTPAALALGGADLIAFLNAKNVYIVGVDGNGLEQLTSDGTIKHDLQWMPNGKEVLYISGRCIQIVDIGTKETRTLTCFATAEYLDAFRLSPDGKQVAISLNRELYVVDFDQDTLAKAHTRSDLAAMNGCFTQTKLVAKEVRWSKDGQKLAVVILAPGDSGGIVDMLRVWDIHRCNAVEPVTLDTFPASRFTMIGYDKNPSIPSFDWDGATMFLLNSTYRNEGFGYLYKYDMEKFKGSPLYPLGSTCCYRDARWSPDGSYVIFAFQDINIGNTIQLFYINYGTIGAGAVYKPLPLPADFFTDRSEKPQPVLRPVP
jgi:serine/threonine protein kinase/Tol biopolymer transport system component